MPTRFSLYYPFALTDLVAFRCTDDYALTGETMLVFQDIGHHQVTIRLTPAALQGLVQRLSDPPEQPRPLD